MAGSPYALTGETDAPTDVQHAGSPIRRDPDSLRWQVPFVLGGFNRQIVLRTDALLDHAYGEGFRYREVLDTGRGPLGAVLGAALVAAISALVAGMSAPPTRAVLDRLLPDPGDGPDERTRRRGRFRVAVHATTTTGARYKTTVAAPYDPGYGGTAVLLAETALALAGDELPDRAGVLTPMTAIGTKLADRLRNRDFTVQTRRLS